MARGRKSSLGIVLSPEEHQTWDRGQRSTTIAVGWARRGKSILLLAAGPRACFPPDVAIHVVRLACERPDALGRSLSQWDGADLARQLITAERVEDIAVATVRRSLASHQRKPWRHHLWRYPKHPRDAAF